MLSSTRSGTCANSLAKMQPARRFVFFPIIVHPRGKMRRKLHANSIFCTQQQEEKVCTAKYPLRLGALA
eukprot:5687489-Ditylum_brightwellii.AAC.1